MSILFEVRNRKATFNYQIEDGYTAGIELKGDEVKSVKLKKLDITDAYVTITKKLEAFVHNMNIQIYDKSSAFASSIDPKRSRRLLLKKKEIYKLSLQVSKTGKTIVPTRLIYTSNHLVKVEISVVSALKKYDKRQKLKEKDMKRQNFRDDCDI
jgi:SsrA-binding protein